MLLLLFCIAIVCASIAFTGQIPTNSFSPFFTYIILELQVFLENPALLLFCFGVVLFVVWKLDKTASSHKQYGKLFLQSFFAIGIGCIASFVLLLIVAWMQLNTIAFMLHENPGVLGITDNTHEIIKALQNQANPPDILPSSPDKEKQVVAIAHATVGITNFYGNTILDSIPSWTIITPDKTLPSAFLVDNILIVNALDTKTLSLLSPTLGNMLVQNYFPLRKIKASPHIQVFTPTTFSSIQKHASAVKAKQLTSDITLLQTQIASLSAIIQQNTTTIATEQAKIQDIYTQKNHALGSCESQGNYIAGQFVPTHTLTYCKNIAGSFDSAVDSENKLIDTLNADTQKQKSQQQLLSIYLKLLLAEQPAFINQQATIPDELGVFNPPNTIQVVVYSTSSEASADFLETLTHEYLHYASYNPSAHFGSSFFEEGLTEYFARKIIESELHVTTHLGYPIDVAIITQIMQTIPESEFTDLYFTKDEIGLENKLNLAYGDNFYLTNYPLFQAIQYTIDPEKKLAIANTIMSHIHGPKLTQKDVVSSFSSL